MSFIIAPTDDERRSMLVGELLSYGRLTPEQCELLLTGFDHKDELLRSGRFPRTKKDRMLKLIGELLSKRQIDKRQAIVLLKDTSEN